MNCIPGAFLFRLFFITGTFGNHGIFLTTPDEELLSGGNELEETIQPEISSGDKKT